MLWTSNICRICAQVSEICIPIFEKNATTTLDTKIKRCLSLNISKDDLKPKQVCQECLIKLNDFYSFYTLFHDSNYRFETILFQNTSHNVNLPEAEYVDLDLSLTTSEQKHSIINYKDDIIPLENLDERDFNEQNIINEIVKQTDVNIDMQNFASDTNILVDIPAEASYLGLGIGNNEIAVSNEKQLKESTYSKIDLNECTNNKKKNLISVQEICKEVEKQQKLGMNHIPGKCRQRRLKNTRISKPVKQQPTVDNSDYQEQIFNNILNQVFDSDPNQTPLSSFTPNFYAETIPSSEPRVEGKLNVVSVTTIRKPTKSKTKLPKDDAASRTNKHSCKECGKSFARRHYLNEHIKKHDNVKPYECDVCNKTFAIKWDLTFHKRIHTNLYSCSYCNKCFSAPSKLQRHVRTHTGERPFVCTYENCGRSFSDKRNLIGHEITHTNIRKFLCTTCKRAYKTKNQLKEHMQAHSEVPAFQCEICKKSYRWKTNLILHMKKHSGYVCSGCNKDCEKISVFLKHKKECQQLDCKIVIL